MSKKRIIIAGGGFAGLSALRTLARERAARREFEILIVDKKPYSEFLPMLPDVAGGWLGPDRIRGDIERRAGSAGAAFLQAEIIQLDPDKQKIKTTLGDVSYDHIIVCTGAETNFYGNNVLREKCFSLYTVREAEELRDKALEKGCSGEVNIVVSGGGYTGIEIASSLDTLLKNNGVRHNTVIVEKSSEILMMVPGWMRDEAKKELTKLDITVITGASVSEYDGSTVTLSSGETIQRAICVWAAGVKTPRYIESTPFDTERSRIVVDKCLAPISGRWKNIFAAGDSAGFNHTKDAKPLRMAVMFSLEQGRIAALNTLNSIDKSPLIEYSPLDLGYLIPVASGKAPGVVLGAKVHGLAGYLMHYFMCVYRSLPAKRTGIIMDFLKKGRNKK